MNKRKTILKIISLGLLALFICIWGINYIKINKTYPKAEYVKLKIGEDISYGDITIKGIEYDYYCFDELKTKFDYNIDYTEYESYYNTDDLIFICVKVLVSNIGEKDVTMPLYNTTISSKTYSNGIDTSTFTAMNGGLENLFPVVKAGDWLEVNFTYTLFKSVLYKDYNELPKLELIFQLYPQRLSICLN